MDAKTWENSECGDDMLAALAELDDKQLEPVREDVVRVLRQIANDVETGYCERVPEEYKPAIRTAAVAKVVEEAAVAAEAMAVREVEEPVKGEALEGGPLKGGEIVAVDEAKVEATKERAVADIETWASALTGKPREVAVPTKISLDEAAAGDSVDLAWAIRIGTAVQAFDEDGDLRKALSGLATGGAICKAHWFSILLRMTIPEWPGR